MNEVAQNEVTTQATQAPAQSGNAPASAAHEIIPATVKLTPVPFTAAETSPETYIPGAELASADEETAQNAMLALQTAAEEMAAGFPDENILYNWPQDADGNLIVSDEYDYHIIQRTTGAFAENNSKNQAAHHIVHFFATPSLAAVLTTEKGREYAEAALASNFKRRIGGILASGARNGEFDNLTNLREWISARDSGTSENAARGSTKLFNAIAADLAKSFVRAVPQVKLVKADVKGILSSKLALMDKYQLHDKPAEAEQKIADFMFSAARRAMLAHAQNENAAWADAPAVDENGEAKAEKAPWPTNAAGEVTEASLQFYMKPLDQWAKERDEATAEPIEIDLSAFSFDEGEGDEG